MKIKMCELIIIIIRKIREAVAFATHTHTSTHGGFIDSINSFSLCIYGNASLEMVMRVFSLAGRNFVSVQKRLMSFVRRVK